MKITQKLVFNFSFSIIFCFLLSSCFKSNKIEISGETVEVQESDKKPLLKVFLENSGSMDGYMCDGSQLKDALYDYISELNRLSDTTSLYFINSKIIPYSGKLQAYIKDMTPATFHSAGGNTSNTDIGDLMDKVLSTVNDSTVSIFISDCILDLPTKNATAYLNNCEITIKENVLETQKRVPNLGVEILQLTSKFSGKYFSSNGKVEVLNDVQRPYYIWIFGDKNFIAKFNQDAPYSQLEKYNLKGVVSFSNESKSTFEVGNRTFSSKIIRPTDGNYLAAIKVDLKQTLQTEDIIQNIQYYNFNNPHIQLESISPINQKNNYGVYTHVIYFKFPEKSKIAQDRLTFESPKELPLWVFHSNDDIGDDINSNLDKTIGIKYLIQGIADAYRKETKLMTFKINIKRK